MDSFLSIFMAKLQKNEAACGQAEFGVISRSISNQSFASHEVNSGEGPGRCTRSCEATIVTSVQATDRECGPRGWAWSSMQAHDEWCKAPSHFSATMRRGGDGGQSISFPRPRRPG